MGSLVEFECPCCGGKVEFDSKTQEMKCPFCDSKFDIEAINQFEAEQKKQNENSMEWDTGSGSEWSSEESDGMKVFCCKSCGGQIVASDTTAASKCPYCDNPVVMTGSLEGDLKPDMVVPFKLDKETAKEALMKHLTGKKFLPKMFKDQNHIDEIKGVYVPFWVFNADADADIVYKAMKSKKWSDAKFDYNEKSYYSVRRAGSISFADVPVNSSSHMADDLMESIEPFDFKEGKEFSSGYLSGYMADRYDIKSEDCVKRANERIEQTTKDTFEDTVTNYETVDAEKTTIKLKNGKAKYVLCPVWILNTTWNGEKYTFAMNGQTGKFVGNLPVDKGAYWKSFAFWSVICSAAVYIIMSIT